MYVTLNLNNTVSFPSGDDFQVPTSSSAPRTYFLLSPCVCLQLGFWPSRSAFHKNVKCIQYTDVTHIAQSIRVTQCLRLATVTTFVRIIISPFLTVCIFFVTFPRHRPSRPEREQIFSVLSPKKCEKNYKSASCNLRNAGEVAQNCSGFTSQYPTDEEKTKTRNNRNKGLGTNA